MTNESNQPKKNDAVLGGQSPPPVQGAILGGIEGVKRRLSSSILEARVAALGEAINYGEEGLYLVVQALDDKFRQVRHAAARLLQERVEPQAKLALQHYKFWSGFEKLDGLPNDYATTFANRKVIEFDPKTGITDTVGTAYALRGIYEWSRYSGHRQVNMKDNLQILLQDPRASEVEALVVGVWFEDRTSGSVVNALVAAHQQLTNLKAVFIGDIEDSEGMISSIVQSNLSPLLETYPDLEVLKVRGDNERYSGYEGLAFSPPIRHEKLKALIIESGGLRREVVAQICALELPSLEYLELWLGRDEYGGTSSIEDLMPIISGEVFPKLKYLGVRNSEYSDDIAFAIVQSPLIERLLELDFSMGTLGDDGAEALLNCPAVNQLDTLNVSDNCLTDDMVEQLEQLDIEVLAKPLRNRGQKSPDDRYCSVAE